VTLAAGDRIGKYVVRGKLAEGGMAEIYLAASQGAEGFEKEVVIKRVRSFLATDPGFVDMFIAEARLASQLNHANVVQIFDFAKHEDTYYLAMEYVRGCSLADLSKKCKEPGERMPPVLVAHIGAEVARGLNYAHRLKVNGEPLYLVHRDVTPHNVLLSFDGAVKLTDFGIAKAGNKLTSPGMLKGKFAYMSPEQSRGEAVDARTDVFALGIVLWEMLTGARLFNADSELAVLRAVQQGDIQPPSRGRANIPEDLSAVVMKALARDMAARFQTAGELERALVQCVLNHAQSADDTDLAAFLRRVYISPTPSAIAVAEEQATGWSRGARRPPEQFDENPEVPSGDTDVVARMPGESLSGAERTGARKTGKGVPGEEDTEKLPNYERTVSLSRPAPAPEAVAQAAGEAPAGSRRMGLWAGLGLGTVLALAGVGALVSSKSSPPTTAAAVPPATAEPAPQAVPDAGMPEGTGALAAIPTPEAAPPEARPEPAPVQAAPALGSLTVRATPYATILVNGKSYGEVQGVRTIKLAPGKYTLTLEHPKGKKTESITIEPNSTLRRELRVR